MSNTKASFKNLPWRIVMGLLFAVSLYIVYMRFAYGLGSVTNLSDKTPWGIWVGFDILAGVGLAAGGFVMAATVYVFRIKQYQPMVRMAILTAMLGYLLFVVGLVIEIGRPWNMWKVILPSNFNLHSPLWEVAMCVMTYTAVLILEFSQVVFERLGWKKLQRAFHRVSVPLVILGVLLSTLHQSTLGTLFTIMPTKLHPLWYSPILPVHFYISCIAAGLGMVTFESFLSARFLKHPPRMDLLPELVRVMALILVFYFIFRIVDLTVRGSMGAAFIPGTAAGLFWLENLCFVIIPLVLVFRGGHYISKQALFFASFSVVLGFIMHRFNVAVSGPQLMNPTGYFPSWAEFVLSAALIAAGFVAAALCVKWFPMYPKENGEVAAEETVMRVSFIPDAKA